MDTVEPITLHTDVIADWVTTLTKGARASLDRMDTRLTLAEAKVQLIRHMIERRRELRCE